MRSCWGRTEDFKQQSDLVTAYQPTFRKRQVRQGNKHPEGM